MIRDFFTEDEWDAIYNAMADYQDHGESETELSYSVQEKITELFNWIDVTVSKPSTIGWNRSLIVYCSYMNKTQNPYRQQIIAQGRDPIDAPVLEVPARYRDRFKSYAEYQEAIAEMLNGMWRSTKWHTATCNCPQGGISYKSQQNGVNFA